MKIKELYINHFGKFTDKRVELQDGINIFYGENESGKTTLHTFMKSMLFGLERTRGRASFLDAFRLYEPWDNPNYYAGTLKFESNGKNYCITRNFDKYSKSASLVCEEDGREFSIEDGDLSNLLPGLEAANYDNTISIGQMKVEPKQSLAVALQNFATNYYTTGNSEIDLDMALTELKQKKKITEKEILACAQKREQELMQIQQEKQYVSREAEHLENELKIAMMQVEAQEEVQAEKNERHDRSWIIYVLAILVLAVFEVFLLRFMLSPWNYMIAGTLFALCALTFYTNISKKKKIANEDKQETQELLQKFIWKKERLQEELKEKQTIASNIQERIEEQSTTSDTERKLRQRVQALELATQRIMELSEGVHKELSAKLNNRASAILDEITNGKYKQLMIDEKLTMHLYTGERRISIEQVSRGTIEQVYFALRMSASEILLEEEYPVILDDTFAYYDDQRLENTLRWLMENRKQVIVFTCQKREQEIMDKLNQEM